MAAGNIQEIFNRHRRRLEPAAQQYGLGTSELFTILAAADPSDDPAYGLNKKIYVDWLARHVIAGGLSVQNMPSTTRALRLHLTQPSAPAINNLTPAELHDHFLQPVTKFFAQMTEREHQLVHWKQLPDVPAYKTEFAEYACDKLIEFDPRKGGNVPHLLRWMKSSRAPLLPKDLPKAGEDLLLYHQNRHRLMPASKRSLNNFDTYQDFSSTISQFRPDYSKLSREEMEAHAVQAGAAKMIVDTAEYRLIHITSLRGGQILGKGTRWCTGWDDGDGKTNDFHLYKDDLLYLRIKNGGAAYQLHFGTWMHNNTSDKPLYLDNGGDTLAEFCNRHTGLYDHLKPYAIKWGAKALVHQAINTPTALQDWDDVLDFGGRDPQVAGAIAKGLRVIAQHEASKFPVGKIIELYTEHARVPAYHAELADSLPTVLNVISAQERPGLLQNFMTHLKADPVFKTSMENWQKSQNKGLRAPVVAI